MFDYWPPVVAVGVVGAGLEVAMGFTADVVEGFATFSVVDESGAFVRCCVVAVGWDLAVTDAGVVGWTPVDVTPGVETEMKLAFERLRVDDNIFATSGDVGQVWQLFAGIWWFEKNI